MIERAFLCLENYCKEMDYKGWDVFDGLNSRLFHQSSLSRSSLLRLAWIQLFKRSPINFRKITLVPKGWNAKGLGLFASGLIALQKLDEANRLLERLLATRCNGYAGTSWGYNFPWQARAFYVPEGKPNMVTTVFAANAFLDYYDCTGKANAFHIAQDCCNFILENLIVYEEDDSLCFGYIPGEKAKVHNVNMLGASLLARVASKNNNNFIREKSQKSMAYSVNALQEDNSWPYGELHHHKWTDNFHTGFNLVALNDWMKYTGERFWKEKLRKAYDYFLDTFWKENGCPKYYNDRLYPIDIHCSAQGIVTCIKLRDLNQNSQLMTERIVRWAVENMQNSKGYFYYQKTKWGTNRIPYIRWSQAWMFYALAIYLSTEDGGKNN